MPITFTKPQSNASFPLGDTVEFSGQADQSITRVELIADDQFTLPTTTLTAGTWFVGHRFTFSGQRRIKAQGFDANNQLASSATLDLVIAAQDFGKLVPLPAGINPGVTKARQKTMLDVFGAPGELSQDCTPVTNAKLKKLMVTASVGPFNVTGIKPAVEALTRIFAKVKEQEPELLKQLGTAGMLCCRRIRSLPGKPPSKQFSNHSWGTAIDLKIKGALDPRGDGKTQLGLLTLHPFFNAERFFWGAGFGGAFEDSMHFEASDELVRDWQAKGVLNV